MHCKGKMMFFPKRYIGVLLGVLWCCQVAQAGDFAVFGDKKPRTFQSGRDGVRVVNLWATWCAPCRAEMPELDAFARAHAGKVEVVGIAFDTPENIGKFLQATPVAYEIRYYTGSDSRAAMGDFGNRTGALPYTLAENPRCGFRHPFYGKVKRQDLEKALQAAAAACGQ